MTFLSASEKSDILGQTGLWKNLSEMEREELLIYAMDTKVEPGTLVRASSARNVLYVVSGLLMCTYGGPDYRGHTKEALTIKMLKPGEFYNLNVFTEKSNKISEEVWSVEPSRIIGIDYKRFSETISSNSSALIWMINSLEEDSNSVKKTCMRMTLSAEQRIAWVLNTFKEEKDGKLLITIDRVVLNKLANLARETVTRKIKEFNDRKIISTLPGKSKTRVISMEVLDSEALYGLLIG